MRRWRGGTGCGRTSRPTATGGSSTSGGGEREGLPEEGRRGRGRLLRPLRLLQAFWAVNLAEELQYRGNFLAALGATVFWLGTALLTAGLFFGHAERVGGWGFWEVVVLLGVFNTLAGVVEALMRPNLGRLVPLVRQGTLDLLLVKPVDPQFHVSFRRLVVWHISDGLLGLGLVAYALARLDRSPSVEEILAFAVALGAAVGIVYALWLGLMTLAFWFVAVENLAVLFDALFEAGRFPATAYPRPLRFLFVFVIPMAWITTVPPGVLTGRLGVELAMASAALAAVLLVATRALWRSALRHYTGAGG